MFAMTVPPSTEVLVLLDEVGVLTERTSVLLLELINKWSGAENIKFICTGTESALGKMFEKSSRGKVL